MLVLRSLAFNLMFYVNLVAFLVFGAGFYATPRKWSIRALQTWARASQWWLKVLAGITVEVRGRENIPTGAVLVAGKHQSLWETFGLLALVDDPAMVLKRELTWIPVFGWFALKFRMIAVDRGAGAQALKNLIRQGQAAVALGRQVIIFPEGTRRPPDAEPDYKPGAAALYLKLGVPCVPFALNSGLYWPRRRFLRFAGTIIVEFLPPIAAGLDRKTFSRRLEEVVETATARLVAEGRAATSR
jgi:1-acyl-sn-glycerol-3-phosphate acyltransferase